MDQQVAFIVGAAVADDLAHALEQGCVYRFFVNVENSSYAAHGGWVIFAKWLLLLKWFPHNFHTSGLQELEHLLKGFVVVVVGVGYFCGAAVG